MKINIGIIGAAGYTGGELIRLLLNHPNANISFAHSNSNAGKPLSDVHKDLIGDTDLNFTDVFNTANIEVLFLCVGHGDAKKFLEANPINNAVKIIDLSQDFRLTTNNNFNGKQFVYGLPELNMAQIKQAQYIANPGCFATAIQLALLPLAANKELNEVYITGVTGSTGAGQGLSRTSHFSWRSNNIQAYKSLTHQHMNEVRETTTQLKGKQVPINFVPWRGDFARGIYISTITTYASSLEDAYRLYNSFYELAAFTHVSQNMIDLKQVVNTNKCLIHLEKEGDKLVIHAAIDNLLKGASGQAVQNMNIILGLPETTGLNLKASLF